MYNFRTRGSGLDPADMGFVHAAGQFYMPQVGAYGSGTQAVTANRLYGIPMWIGSPRNFDQALLVITTGAAGLFRLGAYDHDRVNMKPGNLLVQTADMDSTSIATVTAAITARLQGRVWLAALFNATPTVRAFTESGLIDANAIGAALADPSTTGQSRQGCFAAQAFGALPAVFPAITLTTANVLPRVTLRGS